MYFPRRAGGTWRGSDEGGAGEKELGFWPEQLVAQGYLKGSHTDSAWGCHLLGGKLLEVPTSFAGVVCIAWLHAYMTSSQNGHHQMDLVSGDFLICRWAGKGLTQRAEEITLSWEGKGATLGKGVGILSRTVQREILEPRPCLSCWDSRSGPGPQA